MAEVLNGGGGAEKVAADAVPEVVFTAVKPHLLVQAPKASDAVQFYKAAFGAEEVCRTMHPKRKADQELPLILSAELKLADSTVLISDNSDDTAAPVNFGNGVALCLETVDVEAAVAKAVAAGATAEGEIAEGEGACCGGRVGKVKDPYGYVWLICSPAKTSADVEA